MKLGKKNKRFWNFKSLDEKMGELTLYGEISNETWWGDEVTPKEFKSDLDNLGEIDTLNIYINSPGGDVFAGQTIYSILKRHKAHKNVYIDGLAASIASVIAMAGNTIFMPKNSMMMIHNPWTIGMGNASEFRKLAEDLDKIRESLIAAYEGHSALTRDYG
jgi:ATP-dependent Clp protease protease subunit